MLVTYNFCLFLSMFSTLSKTEIITLATFYLQSAKAINVDYDGFYLVKCQGNIISNELI